MRCLGLIICLMEGEGEGGVWEIDLRMLIWVDGLSLLIWVDGWMGKLLGWVRRYGR